MGLIDGHLPGKPFIHISIFVRAARPRRSLGAMMEPLMAATFGRPPAATNIRLRSFRAITQKIACSGHTRCHVAPFALSKAGSAAGTSGETIKPTETGAIFRSRHSILMPRNTASFRSGKTPDRELAVATATLLVLATRLQRRRAPGYPDTHTRLDSPESAPISQEKMNGS